MYSTFNLCGEKTSLEFILNDGESNRDRIKLEKNAAAGGAMCKVFQNVYKRLYQIALLVMRSLRVSILLDNAILTATRERIEHNLDPNKYEVEEVMIQFKISASKETDDDFRDRRGPRLVEENLA